MRPLLNLLVASGTLVLAGCLPDFSPDPLKSDLDPVADGGTRSDAGGDAARPATDASGGGTADASVKPPTQDGGGGGGTNDGGGGTSDDAGGGGGDVGAPPGCDLRGSWFVNEHLGTNVLNAVQIANNWYYYEIDQQGTDLTVKVSVSCGADVNGIGGVSAKADDSLAWPAYMTNRSYAGRKGTVTATADGCDVMFEKDSVVRGATVDAYKDLNVALPKLAQKAANGMPGWEDWDNDNNPGVTLVLSGLASGELYCVTRSWTVYAGSGPKDASLFTLNLDWGQTRENLGSTSDPLGVLRINASRDGNEDLQIVELARLTAEQAAGDDAARCERLRGLAKTLTPNASKL